MKYLIIIAIVFVVAWQWRISRTKTQATRTGSKKNVPPQDMVACLQCGVHLPSNDAIAGVKGAYCCQAHRNQAEH